MRPFIWKKEKSCFYRRQRRRKNDSSAHYYERTFRRRRSRDPAKDKNIGYLAQHQDIHVQHTIYQELLTTKQHILDMEKRLRELEQEMKFASGERWSNSWKPIPG